MSRGPNNGREKPLFQPTSKGDIYMKVLKGLAVLLLLAALPMTGIAQKKKELNPWLDCGIGAMIFTETGWAAAISNVIWDFGTTAVISDQSSQNTCNSKKAQTALYIGVNYASLSEETAKGDGKHLRTMLGIMGCDATAQTSVISSVRSEFGRELRSADYAVKTSAAKAEDFYNIVQGSAGQCRI
jgi:hypothetical protein